MIASKCFAFAGVLSLLALSCAEAPPFAASEPEAFDGRAALARAGHLRMDMRGLEGQEAEGARERAVRAHLELARRDEAEAAVAAESAFRAGELLRAASRTDEARAAFELVIVLDPSSRFAARAGLELGHLERRADRPLEALTAYLAVALDARVEPGLRESAELNAARMRVELGREGEARAGLERVADTTLDPRTAVRAYDEWVRSLVREGRLEEAAGVLEKCRGAARDSERELTPTGLAVRAALERMRAPEELAAAVAARKSERDDIKPPKMLRAAMVGRLVPGRYSRRVPPPER